MVATLEYKHAEPLEAESYASPLCCTYSETHVSVQVHTPEPSEAHKNQYVAFANNPVNFRDPLGLDVYVRIRYWGGRRAPSHAQIGFDQYDAEGNVIGETAYGHGGTAGSGWEIAKGLFSGDISGYAGAETPMTDGWIETFTVPAPENVTKELEKIAIQNSGDQPYNLYGRGDTKNCFDWVQDVLDQCIKRAKEMESECQGAK